MPSVFLVAGVNGAGKSTFLEYVRSCTYPTDFHGEGDADIGMTTDIVELRGLEGRTAGDHSIWIEVAITRLFDVDMRPHLERLERMCGHSGQVLVYTVAVERREAMERLLRRNLRYVTRCLRQRRFRRSANIAMRTVHAAWRYRDFDALHSAWSRWCEDLGLREVTIRFEHGVWMGAPVRESWRASAQPVTIGSSVG